MASVQSDEGPSPAALALPARERWLLQRYEPAVFTVALLAAMALAWLYLVGQAAGMGNRAGTMGLGALAFLGMWAVMVVAMMFPAVGPTGFSLARRSAAGISGAVKAVGATWRLERATVFMIGYFVVWAAFGLALYGILRGGAGIVHIPVGDDKWIAAGVYAVAGVYQFTPAKRACRERCASPRCAIGTAADRPSRRSVVWDSTHHALSCIGCCWAFMAVLVAVGLMNLVAMGVLTVAILAERHFRLRSAASIAIGALLIVAAVLTPFFGWLHPGLSGSPGMPMPMHM
jgi:predicted metal-binding membrane protein